MAYQPAQKRRPNARPSPNCIAGVLLWQFGLEESQSPTVASRGDLCGVSILATREAHDARSDSHVHPASDYGSPVADIVITTTHVVVNALIARNNQHRRLLVTKNARRFFILGGLGPDLGLIMLSAGASIYYPVVRDTTLPETFELARTELFFNSPLWIVLHNTLHAPLVLVALAALASSLRPQVRARLTASAADS